MKLNEKIRYKLLQQTYGRRFAKKSKEDDTFSDMEDFLAAVFGGGKKESGSKKKSDSKSGGKDGDDKADSHDTKESQ